jgi:hypothetical protein
MQDTRRAAMFIAVLSTLSPPKAAQMTAAWRQYTRSHRMKAVGESSGEMGRERHGIGNSRSHHASRTALTLSAPVAAIPAPLQLRLPAWYLKKRPSYKGACGMRVSVPTLATLRSEHRLSRMVQNPLTTHRGLIIICNTPGSCLRDGSRNATIWSELLI